MLYTLDYGSPIPTLNHTVVSFAQSVKRLPAMRETWVRSLGREDPLEEEMATHSSGLEKSHGLRSLVGYSPWGYKELDTTERPHFTSHFRRKFLTSTIIVDI